MKKIGLLLAILVLILYGRSSSVKAAEENGFHYNVSGAEIEITNYTGPAGEIVIPNTLGSGGEPVTQIANEAFRNKGLTKVTVPHTVQVIGKEAFQNNQITNVNLSSTVKEIGQSAFANNALTEIILPHSVTTLGDYAFAENQLTTVDISPNITKLSSFAFADNLLTDVMIPVGVEEISQGAFSKNRLTSVSFPNTLKTLGQAAFSNNYLTDITLPNSLNNLGNWAFQENNVNTVTFNSSPTIGQDPFLSQGKYGVQQIYGGMFTAEDFLIEWDSSVPTLPFVIYAKYEYKVSFDTMGGVAINPLYVLSKGKITEPEAPSKLDAIFDGWYENTMFNDRWDFATDVVTKPLTLYTKWQSYYQVSFDTNGGSAVAMQHIIPNGNITLPSPPTKVDHVFAGWYKDVLFTELWDFVNDKVTADTILYAKWTKNTSPPSVPAPIEKERSTYTIVFNVNGGTTVASQTHEEQQKVVEPTKPLKEGYTFVGWYKDAMFINQWNFTQDIVTENMTLYAKWVENVVDIPDNSNEITEPTLEQPPACPIQFNDIASHWAQKMIEDIAGRCWVKGYPDSTFKPNDSIQRQHVAVIFTRAFDLLAVREMQEFTDITTKHRYYDAIAQVYQAGVFDGTEGKFNPEAPMTRAHMAKVLVEAFDLTSEQTSTFQDVPTTHWAYAYISILADHQIALGDGGYFKPNEPVTRAQFVAFMYRALQQ